MKSIVAVGYFYFCPLQSFHLSQTVSTLQEKNFHLSQTVSALQRENSLLETKLEIAQPGIVREDCFLSADRSNAGNDIGDQLLQPCVEQQLDASCTSVSHHMFFQPTPTNSAATREYDSSPSQKLDFSV